MEPIAVVHWLDNKGHENLYQCFSKRELLSVTQEISEGGFVSWTCMNSMKAALPPNFLNSRYIAHADEDTNTDIRRAWRHILGV